MATITQPASTRAVAVTTGQPLHLVASASVKWSYRVNEGAWNTINAGATEVVWTTPTSLSNRFTFDRIEVAIGADPNTPDDTLDLNLCEGPVAVLHATDQAPNPALEEPPLDPNADQDDDPALGTPWYMPGANRDGFATLPLERASEAPGGPANLVQSFRSGISVDTAGKLGARSSVLGRVSGLGPFPATASVHRGGMYFNHDFGKSRTLCLTRVLFQDGDSHVAVVRGDGRRNTYRWNGSSFDAAAGVQNTLTTSGGNFTETTPLGRAFHFDSNGALTQVVDRYGQPVYYSYDANSRLQKIEGGPAKDASGLEPYLAYDGNGLLERLVLEDPADASNNRTAYFTYDVNRNLTKIIGPESCVQYFEYSGSDPFFLTAVTDPEGFRWEVGYDGSDRVDRVVDARGNEAYFGYDTSAPLTTYKDRAGKATYFDFDAFGSPTKVFNKSTPADYYTFDGEGALTSSKNRLGDAWAFEVDSRGNRISSTDPLSARSYFAWDSSDLLTKFIDPLDRTTYLAHDASRNRTKWVDALDQTTYFTWQSSGLLATRKDRRAAVTTFGFDGQANLTKVTDPLTHATYFAFNSAGEVTEQKDALLRASTLVRDLKGRVTREVDPLGNASYFAYDARCNLVSETDARLNTTTHVYDGNSNRTRTVDALGNPTYFGFDEEDRLNSQKNARFFETTMGYGSLGLLKTQTDALGNFQSFSYDDAHQLTRQRDELGNTTYFAFDAVGRLTHQKNALLEETYFGFDLAGNHVKVEPPLEPSEDPGIFWVDSQADKVVRADLDGSNETSLVTTGLTTPRGIAVDREGGKMYWTDSGTDTVKRADLDGSNVETLVSEQNTPRGIALDLVAGKIYWVDSGDDLIRRADLDGSNLESVAETGVGSDPRGIALDVDAGKMYWTDAASGAEKIKRANMSNGTGEETLVNTGSDLDIPRFIALDLARGKMYWTDSGLDTVKRADLDGSSVETIVSGQSTPSGIALDVIQQKVYWADSGDDRIQRADLDGTNVEQVLSTGASTTPEGLALALPKRVSVTVFDALDRVTETVDAVAAIRKTTYDAEGNALRSIDPLGNTTYFTWDLARRQTHTKDALNNTTYLGYDVADQTILQLDEAAFPTYFSYDDAGRQTAVKDAYQNTAHTGFDRVSNVVFTVPPAESSGLFWADSGNDTIKRADLDGSGVSTLVSTGLDIPRGLAVDTVGDLMYWVDSGNDTIKRARLDGTDVETIVSTGLNTPRGIAVDHDGGKVYWTDSGNDTIKRADLDGSNAETLVSTGLTTPTGIVLDVAAGHMYWTDSGTDTVKRADLDGSNVTTLVSSLTNPVDVGLDVARGKLYWIDSGSDKLSRADLDGSNSEDLVTGLSTPRALAVDPIQQKVYWTDSGTDKIMRCNLDGSDVEETVTSGLATPDGLALQLPTRFTSFSYDAINRQTSALDAYGNQTLSVFDAVGNVTKAVGERGFATYFTFDALDRQTHVKDGVHFAVTYMGYDAASNVVRDVDQLGHASYFTFDRLNRQEFVHDRAGALTYMQFDVVGNLTGQTVFLGAGGEQRDTYFAFDGADRQVEVTDALGGVTSMTYDQAGNLEQTLDQVGRPTYFGFDKLNRQTSRKNALGNTWVTNFDSRGNVSDTADPENRLEEFSYDRFSRQTVRNNSLGEITYLGFDARSNQVLVVNPRGNAAYFTFDRLDRISHRKDQLGGIRYFGFDPSGNQILQQDELGNNSYFTYDGLGRLTHAKDALFNVTYFGFDARSSLVERISAHQGETTYMAHDAAGRMEKQWFAASGGGDTPIYFTYDQTGNVTLVEDGTGKNTTQVWDKLDRLTKKDDLGGTVYYAFDASGMKTSFKDPQLEESVFVYDSVGRLEKVEIEGARTAYYAYDDSDMLMKRVFPGGPGSGKLMAYYTWDAAGRQERIENRGPAYSNLINYFHYERDANGHVTHTRHESNEHTYWQYDALDRMTQDRRINPLVTVYSNEFQYDAASNRTLKADIKAVEDTYYFYDVRNLLEKEWNNTTGATTYFAYDDAQRMTAQKIAGGQSTYFGFNQRDMVTNLDFEKSGGADDSPHVLDYSGLGSRVRLKVGTGSFTETYLAYDGGKLVQEKDDGGNVLKSYRQNAEFSMGNLLEIKDGVTLGNAAMDGFGTSVEVQKDGGEGGEEETRVVIYDAFGDEISTAGFFMSEQRLRYLSPVFVALNTSEGMFLNEGSLYLPGVGAYLASGWVMAMSVGPVDLGGFGGKGWPPVEDWDDEGLGPGVIEAQDKPRGSDPRDKGKKANCCGPDITKWLVGKMQKSSKDKRIRPKTHIHITPFGGLVTRGPNYFTFKSLVETQGDWDFKSSETFELKPCPTIPSRCDNTVTLCKKCFHKHIAGNIHFGFVGRAAEIPGYLLSGFAGAAQDAAEKGGIDIPSPWELLKRFGKSKDQKQGATQVQLGIDLYDDLKGKVTEQELCKRLKKVEARVRFGKKTKVRASRKAKPIQIDFSKNCTPCSKSYQGDPVPKAKRSKNPQLPGKKKGYGKVK